jgi:transcriptional regulator with XRE-family HTH domain
MLDTLSDEVLPLKELIERAGYTQRDLSKVSGIPERTINSWVCGQRVPDLERYILLASYLRVSLKTLFASFGYDVSRIPDD